MKKFSRLPLAGFAAAAGIAVCCFGPVAFAQNSEPAPASKAKGLSTLQFEFQVHLEELNKPLRALGEKYAARLRKVEEGLTRAGRTEVAQLIRKEIESYETGKVEIPRTLTEARRLRSIYERESLPLVRERNRKAAPLIGRYRESLGSLKADQSSQGNDAEVEKIDVTLKALEREQARLAAAAIPGGQLNAEPEPVFSDEFEGGRFRDAWVIRNGNPTVIGGRVRAPENETEIETPLGFRAEEGFRIEFDLEKQGSENHSGWDFEIVVGDLKGSLRFDSGSEDRLTLSGSEGSGGETSDPDSPNQGKAFLTYRDGKARFQFTNSKGRTLDSGWVSQSVTGEAGVRLRLAGGGEDSPRLIDNVRFYRGDAIGDRGS